jgi:hypothetical protein
MQNITHNGSKKIIKGNDDFIEAQSLSRRYDLVREIMANAMKQGEFDNLEGAGKPLKLVENPFEPVELRMVHKVLKDNGYVPYWIDLGKEIEELRAKSRKEVDNFKRDTQVFFNEKRSISAVRRYEIKKNDFYSHSRESLANISKKIRDYNLRCPVSQLGLANLNIDYEMSSIIKDIDKLINDLAI